jgi:hypothetical protein
LFFLLHLEEFLSEVFLVELAKFPQAKTTKIRKEYAAPFLHLALRQKPIKGKL